MFELRVQLIAINTSGGFSEASNELWLRGLRDATSHLLGLWVRIPRGHGCFSVVSVGCCQVEVSATSLSLVQRNLTDCGTSLSVI